MYRLIAAVTLGFLGAGTTLSWAGAPAAQGVMFVTGNNLWQPGTQYANGTDWLALTCTASSCSLVPASLAVHPESWQGHYDERATQGQKLTFRKTGTAPGRVIAWLHADAARKELAPGPVITYASNAAPLKRPATEGTLEVAVDLPNGNQANFVPLLDRAKRAFFLQLRAAGKRQLLGQLGNCSQQVTTGYFLWAGDLDRDGRPDYLVNFVDADGQVILFLSGAAASHELVGVGGTYHAPPFGGECDGGGWIEVADR